MSNKSGPQEDVKYCPTCKADLRNVPRNEMKTSSRRIDGTIPPHTHTYVCTQCGNKFEINQDR